jgi:hypothetical protein
MSAPKMGEYLEANAHRRESILRDQKFPPDFKTARYQAADEVIRRALLQGGDVRGRLAAGSRRAAEKPSSSKFEEQSKLCSLEAIERFGRLYDELHLDGVESVFVGQSTFAVRIEGVSISSRPLVLLKRRVKSEETFGALMVVLRKERGLTDHGGKAIAQLLRTALDVSHLPTDARVLPDLCIVADVFHGTVFRAPKSTKRTLEEIKSACREIAVRWPFIAGVRAA